MAQYFCDVRVLPFVFARMRCDTMAGAMASFAGAITQLQVLAHIFSCDSTLLDALYKV